MADDRKIVDHVDLAIEAGELVAICGPNGAGKSTLLKVLSGEFTPSEGEVTIDGRGLDTWPPKELATRRAMLHQHSELTFPFQVHEVVSLGRYPYPEDRLHNQVVAQCLSRVDMATMANRTYSTLSGGERQRVQFARVLAQLAEDTSTSKLLLLDEPTSALDLLHQETILSIASDCAKELGYAVVVVLHDLNLASHWADRVVFLHEGKIAASGAPNQVVKAETIHQIYGLKAHILTHPDTARPVILPQRTVVVTQGEPDAQPSGPLDSEHHGNNQDKTHR